MKKYYLTVLVCVISILISCSTVKKTQDIVTEKPPVSDTLKKVIKKTKPVIKELHYISLAAAIEFVQNNSVNEFNATILLNHDTLSIKVLAPFSIVVAELFSTPDKFLLLDKWNGKLYKGRPSKENFNKALQIPISYEEITGMIRCAPFGNYARYEQYAEQISNSSLYLFADSGSNDSLWFKNSSNVISKYKHQSSNPKESYAVSYNYDDSKEYPKSIVFVSGKNKLTLKIDKYSFEKFSTKSIKLPENIETFDLDE